jgi:thiol:disulfide interchange protein DsbD
MLTLRAALGVVEIAAAIKFLSNADLVWRWGLLTRNVVIVLWIATALVLALLLSGVIRGPVEPERAGEDVRSRRISPMRAVLAVGTLAIAAWMATGLRGHRLGELEAYLPPPLEGALLASTGSATDELSWMLNDYERALEIARAEQRPVLVDFTGYTCTNCRWMEANMFPRGEVRALLARFVRVRLFTDGQGPLYERQQRFQQRTFGTVALPYYAVVAPTGAPVATFLGMTRDPEEFTRFLTRGVTAPSSQQSSRSSTTTSLAQ